MRGALVLGIATGLSWATPARAEPLTLDWSAPEGCPDQAAVRRRIDELLGGPPSDQVEPVSASATVTRTSGGWSLSLTTTTRGTTGQRQMASESCEALAKSAALIVALAVDPEAVAANRSATDEGDAGESLSHDEAVSHPEPPLAFEPLPPAPPALSVRVEQPPPPPPMPPPAVSRDDEDLGLRLAVGLRGDSGSLPNPGLGIGGDVAWAVSMPGGWYLSPRVTGTYYLPQREPLASRGDVGGDFDFFAFGLLGCPGFAPGKFQLGACLGVEVGRMRGEGFGVDNPSQRVVTWSAFLLGINAAWRFWSPLALRLDIGVAAPFSRPEWLLEGIGELDRPGSLSGRLALGLEVQL